MGWGPAHEPASQCARVCQNYPLANYPLVSPWQIRFRRVRRTVSNTELSEIFCPHRVSGRELSELLSASQPITCVPERTHRVSFAELTAFFCSKNSVSSLFRNSTLDAVFHPFPSSDFPCLQGWTLGSIFGWLLGGVTLLLFQRKSTEKSTDKSTRMIHSFLLQDPQNNVSELYRTYIIVPSRTSPLCSASAQEGDGREQHGERIFVCVACCTFFPSSIYIYIYTIYMHAVKSLFWPSLTLFKVNILAKSKSIFWPKVIFAL